MSQAGEQIHLTHDAGQAGSYLVTDITMQSGQEWPL